MALIKEIITKYGISANYWNIHYLRVDTISKCGYLIVRGYADEHTSNCEPLEEVEFTQPIPDDIRTDFFKTFIYERSNKLMTITRELDNILPIDPNWILTYVYNMLKTTDKFLGAIDSDLVIVTESQEQVSTIVEETIPEISEEIAISEEITINEEVTIQNETNTSTENTVPIEPITL